MADDIQVLIVDDEPLARLGLRRLIESADGYAVAGESRDGVEALECIRATPPDIVLLDIEMPGAGAFDVLNALGDESAPAIILVTAYADQGLEAFDAGVLDYVLKPVDPERLQLALKRAATTRRVPVSGGAPEFMTRVVTNIAGRVRIVPTSEIHWIKAAGSYVRLHTSIGEILHRESLTGLVKQLDPRRFIRIHRSTVVAVDHVTELMPAGHGDALLHLRGDQVLTVSRRYRAALAERLGQ